MADSERNDGKTWIKSSALRPIRRPLNLRRLNAKAAAAPIKTEEIAVAVEIISEFFIHAQ